MTAELLTIEEADISTAWARVFLKLVDRGVSELSPLIVNVKMEHDPEPEDCDIRDALNGCIDTFRASGSEKLRKLQTVHTVANTIFPRSLWNPEHPNSAKFLFDRFEKAWPRIKRCRDNYRGSYFRRMTAFQPKNTALSCNQLQHVIDTYKSGNHRRSALQVSILDPTRDLNDSRQQPFPCLQQVAFAPIAKCGLSVTGFYATQYVVNRAYGNYLGLCRLGDFVARQLDLQLVRMTCIASVALLGTPNKSDLDDLATRIRGILGSKEGSPE